MNFSHSSSRNQRIVPQPPRRFLIPIALVVFTTYVGLTWAGGQDDSQAKSEPKPRDQLMQTLRTQRLELLEKRFTNGRKWVDAGIASPDLVMEAEIDFLLTKAEYAKESGVAKKSLLKALEKFDELIELLELGLEAPNANIGLKEHDRVLWMKAERIRVRLMALEAE